MTQRRKLPHLLSLACLCCSPALYAASFDIANGVTETTGQTLNDNETGVIQLGGVLSVAGPTAVNATGSVVKVTNNGSITTTGDGGYGIFSRGANATISNSGSITTTGLEGYGIASDAANATISNSGSITTTGSNGYGIVSVGLNATISNSGSIVTTGALGFGIYSDNANATISNSGSITSARSLGIFATGADATISNSGSIVTTGDAGFGIASGGANATIINSGSIATTGSDGNGITSEGANAIISNSGSIATTGDRGLGIASGGVNATISNSGSIATTGDSGLGIRAVNTNATISNSGSIATSGAYGDGIASFGADATISNSGSIATTGSDGYGIASEGANAIISNSGSISVTGAAAIGIYSDGLDGTINLSGRISATGAATEAILGGNHQTLNLLPGAAVIGSIDLGSGTNRVNVTLNRGGPSATMSITNPGDITQSGKGLSFVNGHTVSIVDTTHLTATQAALGAASSTQFQAVNQQLNRGASAPKAVKVASNQLTAGMLHQAQGPTAWGHAFGGNAKRDESGAALGYKDTGYGLIGGHEQTLSEHRVGFFGGASRSDLKTTTASTATNSDSLFLGVYGQYKSGNWLLNGSLAGGYVSYDSTRSVVDNLSGYESAKSNYHSMYLSPSVALIRLFDMGAGLSLRPSAQLNYTHGWVSGYDETGTTRSNLSVNSYKASVLNSRVQMAVRQDLADHQGEFEVRLGASQSNYGDDKVKISLQGGAATDYGMTGTSSISGGYVGVGGRIALKNQFSLVGDVEYTRGSGNNNRAVVGYLGIGYRF